MKEWYLLDKDDYEVRYSKDKTPEEYVRWLGYKYNLEDYGSPEADKSYR